MIYAISILAHKIIKSNVTMRHLVGSVEAVSEDEARGKASRLGLKHYPPQNGWKEHHVLVQSIDHAVGNIDNYVFEEVN